MSYSTLPHELRSLVESELTPKQLEAFRLEADGYGTMQIARMKLTTRSAIRDRLHNAHTTLLKRGWKIDPVTRNWYREEAA